MNVDDKLLDELLKMSGLKIKNTKERNLLKKQLSETLKYIENLSDINTEEIEPAYFSSDSIKNQVFNDGEKNKRALFVEDVIKLSKSAFKNYFKVKRIV